MRLTPGFLFTSLAQIENIRFRYGDETVFKGHEPAHNTDPLWLKKLILEFIHGRALVPVGHDPIDPSLDFTKLAMPKGKRDDFTGEVLLDLSMGSLAPELNADWFAPRPYDTAGLGLPTLDMVPFSLNAEGESIYNPRHPAHSIIPPTFIMSEATDSLFAPEHATHPLRAAIQSLATDNGRTYRRVDLLRPPYPGYQPDNEHRRTYPLHQWVLEDSAGGRQAMRIPLNGCVYLSLADGDYQLSTTRRDLPPVPANDGAGSIRLSTQPPGARIHTTPQPSIMISLTGGTSSIEVFVNTVDYDGELIWSRYDDLTPRRIQQLRHAVASTYNLRYRYSIAKRDEDGNPVIDPATGLPQQVQRTDVNRWFIPVRPGFADHSIVYGYIRQSAGRHHMSPEFIQTILMGEGVAALFPNRAGAGRLYDSNHTFIGDEYLGFDSIADGHPAATPAPVAPDIGLQQLIDENYIDGIRFPLGVLSNIRHLPLFEGEPPRDHFTADVTGWEAAIELMAAELHARLDQMLQSMGKSFDEVGEPVRRFSAYVRFNADLVRRNWETIANDIDNYATVGTDLKPWSGTPINSSNVSWPTPPDRKLIDKNFRPVDRLWFTALRRTATSLWHEQAEVYR